MSLSWRDGKKSHISEPESVKEDWEEMLSDEDIDENDGNGVSKNTEDHYLDAPGKSTILSEEMARKLAIKNAEEEDNLESARDLFGEPKQNRAKTTSESSDQIGKSSASVLKLSSSSSSKSNEKMPIHASGMVISGTHYSIDLGRPRTKEDFDVFQKALLDKLLSLSESPNYPSFVDSFVRSLISDSLTTSEIRKIVGELQTLLNMKLQKKDTASTNITSITSSGKAKGAKPSLKFGGSMKATFGHDYSDYNSGEYDEGF